MKNKKILIISSEMWGDIFVSKHHYAKVLARSNEVYFLNPVSINWRLGNFFRIPIKITQESDLKVLSYGNNLPAMALLPYWLQSYVFYTVCRKIHKRLKINTFDIVWSFDFKRFYNLKTWNARHYLFHAVELIDHPYFIKDAPFRHLTLKSADVVISIAKLITKQILPWNGKVLELNHGIDLNSMNQNKEQKQLPGINKIKAGFVGNFQKSFDFSILRFIAEQNTNIDFIMIGPKNSSNLGNIESVITDSISELEKFSNIFFIGAVPSNDLSTYLKAIDINLIIYKDSYSDGHCNPHKLMQYFYFGKVIVSSFIDQYKDDPDFVCMKDSNDDLPSLFREVSKNLNYYNRSALIKKRREFAIRNDYINHISDIEKYILNSLA